MKNLKNLLKKLLGIIFPNRCLYCDDIVAKDKLFCDCCAEKLEPISDPKCPICSHQFEVEIKGMQPLCTKCLKKKPSYEKAICLFRYNHIIKKPIAAMKYRDQSFLAKKFAQILVEKVGEEISDADLIVAVPMQIDRLKKRKFNQTVLLARNIARIFPHMDFFPDFLLKIKATIPQSQLTKKEREKNLKRAFLVNKKYRDLVVGKKVLLLDDVITTGTTIENCAKELKRRGAKEVRILAIAKTVFNRI